MDSDYLEQKNAELARAKQQCVTLKKQHDDACFEYDMFADESGFEYCTYLANLLLQALDDLSELQKDVNMLKGELTAPTTGQDFIGSDPYSFLAFFRPSKSVVIATFVVVLTITCFVSAVVSR